jgi:hypothetical protein
LEKPCDHYLLCISEGTEASCPSKANGEKACAFTDRNLVHIDLLQGSEDFDEMSQQFAGIKLRISVTAIGQRWWGKVKIEYCLFRRYFLPDRYDANEKKRNER